MECFTNMQNLKIRKQMNKTKTNSQRPKNGYQKGRGGGWVKR